jgi:hypothetical protein
MAKMVWDRTKPKMTEGTPVSNLGMNNMKPREVTYVTVKEKPAKPRVVEYVTVNGGQNLNEEREVTQPPSDVIAGNSLREIIGSEMANQGYTSYELSRESGVSKSVIGRFLKGERDVTSKTLDKMFGSLGLVVARRND